MKILTPFIFFLILLISGCATNEHLKKDLKKASVSENRIVLNEDATFILKSPVGIPSTFGLRRGIYKPEMENEFGTFYRGPEGCVIHVQDKVKMGPYDGGVWMPKDKINNRPSVYYFFNYNKNQAYSVGGLVLGSILEANEGNITFVPPATNKTFLDDVYITNF